MKVRVGPTLEKTITSYIDRELLNSAAEGGTDRKTKGDAAVKGKIPPKVWKTRRREVVELPIKTRRLLWICVSTREEDRQIELRCRFYAESGSKRSLLRRRKVTLISGDKMFSSLRAREAIHATAWKQRVQIAV
ncbi:hypothetical protein JTB14_005891 [Gonioctena quinquepunctata]|nr:hypothetical protein JTB14_005891 [Gonioctena quinquepunctata]